MKRFICFLIFLALSVCCDAKYFKTHCDLVHELRKQKFAEDKMRDCKYYFIFLSHIITYVCSCRYIILSILNPSYFLQYSVLVCFISKVIETEACSVIPRLPLVRVYLKGKSNLY